MRPVFRSREKLLALRGYVLPCMPNAQHWTQCWSVSWKGHGSIPPGAIGPHASPFFDLGSIVALFEETGFRIEKSFHGSCWEAAAIARGIRLLVVSALGFQITGEAFVGEPGVCSPEYNARGISHCLPCVTRITFGGAPLALRRGRL